MEIIKVIKSDWTVDTENGSLYLNEYMNQLETNELQLDLSSNSFQPSSFYSIKIPNKVSTFSLIGKNVDEVRTNIYASLGIYEDRSSNLDCIIENISLSAPNPNDSQYTDKVTIDIACLKSNKQSNTLTFKKNNSINTVDDNFITVSGIAGIHIGSNKRLIIKGNNEDDFLESKGYYQCPGIGSNHDEGTGDIILKGEGTIKIRGGDSAPAIGDGNESTKGINIIDIGDSINVVAYAGENSCAIGISNNAIAEEGVIKIHGQSKVKAYGGNYSAAIGTSKDGKIKSIEIYEASQVEARANIQGAAIGTGVNGKIDNIKISIDEFKGDEIYNINATGGQYGSGIGTGRNGQVKHIEILGNPNIRSRGGSDGSGIGTGYASIFNNEKALVEQIEIRMDGDGEISAIGGYYSAGIGEGEFGNVNNILICSSGNLEAIGNYNADDIGNYSGNTSTTIDTTVAITSVKNIDKPALNTIIIKTKNNNIYADMKVTLVEVEDEYTENLRVKKIIRENLLRIKAIEKIIGSVITDINGEIKFYGQETKKYAFQVGDDKKTRSRSFFMSDLGIDNILILNYPIDPGRGCDIY